MVEIELSVSHMFRISKFPAIGVFYGYDKHGSNLHPRSECAQKGNFCCHRVSARPTELPSTNGYTYSHSSVEFFLLLPFTSLPTASTFYRSRHCQCRDCSTYFCYLSSSLFSFCTQPCDYSTKIVDCTREFRYENLASRSQHISWCFLVALPRRPWQQAPAVASNLEPPATHNGQCYKILWWTRWATLALFRR